MNDTSIATYLNRHENYLRQLVERQDFPSLRLKEAMVYALFPGGKRFRPLLVYLAGELLDTNLESLDVIAAAIELTHGYSLVHDDLPAMDNDDFRRGRPSCHRQFDEGTAILLGDSLQILAIEILMAYLPPLLPAEKIISLTHELTKASGPSGMISGQCLDLYELGPNQNSYQQDAKSGPQDLLLQIHELKTGQLIMACMNMVIAASSNPSNEEINALCRYAHDLGLAFQMQDDYLDCYASPDLLGKGRASDESNKKMTFAQCYSQAELSQLIATYYQSALDALNYFGAAGNKLLELTNGLIIRGNVHP